MCKVKLTVCSGVALTVGPDTMGGEGSYERNIYKH